jgi:RNA recognition motif-containing protein
MSELRIGNVIPAVDEGGVFWFFLQTGRSRGFAFIHFRNIEDSIEVMEEFDFTEIDITPTC